MIRKLLGLIICILLMQNAFGYIVPPAHERIEGTVGSPVSVGANKTVLSSSVPLGAYMDYDVNNFLSMGINHNTTKLYGTPFDNLDVLMDVETFDASGNPLNIFQVPLNIAYKPYAPESYKDVDIKKFPDAYKFKFTISSITLDGVTVNDLPENVLKAVQKRLRAQIKNLAIVRIQFWKIHSYLDLS